MTEKPMVKTRFAPSPTGTLHIGGARTALFNYLFAKHTGGEFLVRIEDTDKERSTKENVDIITQSLEWLGLLPDEEYVFQSKREGQHKEAVQKLLASGAAYEDDGAIRFRVEDKETAKTSWKDLVQGQIDYPHNSPSMKDFVIARSDGSPTYNLAVVVDDHDMDITHVIRGDDHINNTPKQILLYKALGWNVPEFAHVPLIHGDDGKKLSKRHGATSVLEYKALGYLPEALNNYLLRLGWAKGDEEIISREKAIELFDINDVNKGASTFNTSKLSWLNAHYMKQKDPVELARLVGFFFEQKSLSLDDSANRTLVENMPDFLQRAKTLVELADYAAFLAQKPPFRLDEKCSGIIEEGKPILSKLENELSKQEGWDKDSISQALNKFCEKNELKFKQIGMPLRVALTGTLNAPGVSELLLMYGKNEALNRIHAAVN